MKRQEIYWILILFFGWRTALFFVGLMAGYFLPYNPTFPYAFTLLPQFGLPQWLFSWAGFDGVHYLTIAINGYHSADLIQAFFPVYPLLIWVLSQLFSNPLLVGLVISNISVLGAMIVLFLIVKQHYQTNVAWLTLGVLLLFPSSFFLGALYSESLFLLLALLVFYFGSRSQWRWVAIFTITASATRLVGIFLVPSLLLVLASQKGLDSFSRLGLLKFLHKNTAPILLICFGSVGLFAYMSYLWHNFSDPVYFWHVQADFGGGRQEQLILLPQVVWRYLKILVSVPLGRSSLIYGQELIFGLLPAGLIGYEWLWKRAIPASWAVFSLSTLLLPTLTGTFSSMPRYALVAFPVLIILGRYLAKQPPWIQLLSLSISAILLMFNLVLFSQGYWVA